MNGSYNHMMSGLKPNVSDRRMEHRHQQDSKEVSGQPEPRLDPGILLDMVPGFSADKDLNR